MCSLIGNSGPIARRTIIILVTWVCRSISASPIRCTQNLVKDFRNVHLTYVAIECGIVLSYMYGFPGLSGNLLPVLVCDCKLRYVSFRVVMGYTVLENSTGRWGIVFLDPDFWASTGFSNVRRITFYIRAGPLINHILVQLCWDFVFRVHEQGFNALHSLKIIWTLMSLNILLNSSLSPWKYGTEIKASLVVSWVGAWSPWGLLLFF